MPTQHIASQQHSRRRLLALLACAVILSTAGFAHAQAAHILTFDASGANTKAGGFEGTYPAGVNASGTIAGSYQDKNSVYYGFVRSPEGKYESFAVPGAIAKANTGTFVQSINDWGEIIGVYADANGVDHGFLRTPHGNFIIFDAPGAGGYGTIPISLNVEGAIVGYYTDANYLFHSFVRFPDGQFSAFLAPGQCTTNGSQGCYGSEVTAINPAGLSVGNYMDDTKDLVQHGLIRHPDGAFTTFEAPEAGRGAGQGTGCPGCIAALNDYGEIAGIYADSNTVYHGFIRTSAGTFKSFDAPGAGSGKGQGTGCSSDCPVILNNRGELTGVYIDSGNGFHTYLREPNGEILGVEPAGSIFTFPAGINYQGAIVGEYVDANDVYHGFLRTP